MSKQTKRNKTERQPDLQAKVDEVRRRQEAQKNSAKTIDSESKIDDMTDTKLPIWQIVLRTAGWCLWLFVAYFLSALVVSLVAVAIKRQTGFNPLGNVAWTCVLQLVQLASLLAIVVGIPYRAGKYGKLSKAKRRAAKMKLLGISRLPEAADAMPLAASVAVYYIGAIVLTGIASLFLPSEVINQAQDVGFSATGNNLAQVIAIMVVLAGLTPIFEELVFRGFLYGKIRSYANFWAAATVTSLIFAVAHGQINVGLTTFVLSMVACYAREKTGASWVGIGLHMVVNFIACFFVYILPLW